MREWVQNEWKQRSESLKENLKGGTAAVLGLERGQSYHLTPEVYQEAETTYRNSQGKNPADIAKIRTLFSLKEGETSPDCEKFLKEMSEKYTTIPENGVTYARTDAAILNYEDQIGAALEALGRWISDNEAKIALIGAATLATGLVDIRDIIRTLRSGAMSVAKTVEKVSERLTSTVIHCGLSAVNHPFLSVLGFSAAFLAERGAIMACKRTYIPENFTELAKALSPVKNARLFFGDQNPVIEKFAALAKSSAGTLMQIGDNFTEWVGGALQKFTREIIPEVVQSVGRTPEKNNEVRNAASIDHLQSYLEEKMHEESKSGEQRGKLIPEKYQQALTQLAAFREAFLEDRCGDDIQATDAPQNVLTALQEALQDPVIGISVEVRDGLVWWKKPDGTEVNLCVDPTVTDAARFHELSDRLRQGEEQYGEYVFFRVVQGVRENMARAGEIWPLPEGSVCAMVIGNLVYWTDPENAGDFFVAPFALFKDLFSDKTWAEYGGDVALASGHAGIMVGTFALAKDAVSRIKTITYGGRSPFTLGHHGGILRRTWQVACGMNPITAPLKVVQDAAGGILDINLFHSVRGVSGKDVNILLQRAGLRPQWVGVIAAEPFSSERQLRRVAFLMGEEGLEGLSRDALRARLLERVTEKMKNITTKSVRLAKTRHIADYPEIIAAIREWYQVQGKVSKLVLVENAIRFTRELPRMGWVKLGNLVVPPPAIAAERQMGKLLQNKVWADAMKKMGSGASLGDVEAALQLAKDGKLIELDAKTLSLIRQSAKAKEIIVGAAQTGDIAEVTRALKAAKMAAGARAFGNTLALAGDSFGVFMAYCDWELQGRQIAATTNPALKDLHKTMQNVALVEGGVSAAGVVIQGCVFTKALLVGEGLLAAAGTTALSVVVLPVVAAGLTATFVARPIANRLYAVAQDWTEEERDMVKYHQGELLRRLEAKAPGMHGYWQRRTTGYVDATVLGGFGRWIAQPVTGRKSYQDWKEGNYRTIEDNNSLERFRVTRALFTRMVNLPQEAGETEQ
ncbi:MAG: hypothetical protein V1876_04280, partial [Candidatus Peregrinibacteria bacterium]